MTRLTKRHDARLVSIAPSAANKLDDADTTITGIYCHRPRRISFVLQRRDMPDAVLMRDDWQLVQLWSDNMKASWLEKSL